MIGSTISHYKILEKLGEGGMGVVYKAQDTKLDRLVALKFLPEHLHASAEEKARFLQEAKAAATLNHPNVCTIYDIKEEEGKNFIVMEFVDGVTLREKFAENPIPVKEAVTYAIQIGEALEEAHSKGIVHRDIKSDNIMVNKKNQIKVMDFGLAKLKGSLKLTKATSTVGTLGYMAPEQIQGGETDARSDIFSFGVVLFEMLTRRLPFRGEHDAAMMYSILNEDPQNIEQLVPEISPLVSNLIQRCLEKDAADRYQHVDDVVADLRRSQKKTSRIMRSSVLTLTPKTESLLTAPVMQSEGAKSAAPIRRPVVMMSVAVAAIALITLAVWIVSRPSLPTLNPGMVVATVQIPATEYQYPGISPDGKWITFPGADLNGNWDIYMMFIETGENKRVTSDSSLSLGNAASAEFSPDGSSIVYGRRNRFKNVAEVCVVSVLSGQVRVIADTGVAPQWSPAGNRIFYYRAGGGGRFRSRSGKREYWSVSPQGGDSRIELIDSLSRGTGTYFTLGVSPDGKKFIFTRGTGGTNNEIYIHDLETGKETQLTHDEKSIDEADWEDNGYIFYTSNRSGNFNIWAIPEGGGDAVQVTRGAGPDAGLSYSSAANRLVYSQRTQVATLWMVNADGSGNKQVYPDENISQSHISPDGNTIVLQIFHPTLLPTLMLREIAGGRQEVLFPFDSLLRRAQPRWSPSGNALAYTESRAGRPNPSAKILDLAGGRRVRDLGEGIVASWISDTVVQITRNSSPNNAQPNYNSNRLLNLLSGEETVFFRDTINARLVLENTAITFVQNGVQRLTTMEQLRRDPNAEGKIVTPLDETSWSIPSKSWFYYRTKSGDALWKIDLRTLGRTKILDLVPKSDLLFGSPDYADKVITYSVRKLKTNIIKVDNLFLK